jgi:hypothetical protein
MKNHPEELPGEEEPWSLIFPRRKAKDRVKNEQKSRRVVFVMDETGYSEWNEQRERYMRAAKENPPICYLWMLEAIRAYPVEEKSNAD